MHAKSWFRGIALCLLGVFVFVSTLSAGDPPWPPGVLIVALDPHASEEGSDTATFLVVRTGPANAALTVEYALGGSAANGVDYDTLPGSVTIPSGAHFAPVVVTPIDDFLVEGAEPVVIALLQPPVWPPPYIVTWPSVAFAEIADNDRPPTNTPPVVSLVRPPDGAFFEAGDDILLVARAFDRDGRVVTVEFFAGNQSLGVVTSRPGIAAADVLSTSSDPLLDLDPKLLPDVDATADTIPIPIPGNLFRLIWPNAPPGVHELTAVATDNDGASMRSASVEITVTDSPPRSIVTIRAPDPVATEPDPNTDFIDTATFVIHRRGPTNFPLQVFYRISGTASNGVDYQELPHSVEIPEGERSVEIAVEPLDDLLVEGRESVVVTIVPPICIAIFPPPPECYTVGRADTARAVIRDNDTPPSQPPLVRLVKPEDGDVFLAPADIRLVALAHDPDGFVTTVEFFEGTNTLGVVTNNPTTDSVARPAFSLVWSNVPPGRYVLTAVATDNDGEVSESKPVEIKVLPRVLPPVVNITTIDAVAAETPPPTVPNPAVFSVTRTEGTHHPLVVFYRVGGSASNGDDYEPLSGRVLIPAGARSNTIVVAPIDDDLIEGIETVIVKLEHQPVLSPSNAAPEWWYRIGSNDVARAFIRDDDFPLTNHPPRVAIVHPDDGDAFCAPKAIHLAAIAHDPDGGVRTVEFFDGTNSLGIVTNVPHIAELGIDESRPDSIVPEQLFRLLWENPSPGGHILTAVATDNRGASSRSEPIHIRVHAPRPPVVVIYATDPYASEGNLIGPSPANTSDTAALILHRKTATFTVGRLGCVDHDLTVYYRLGGTAENGVDYEKLSGEVTIPRGARRAKIVVEPIDDKFVEGTETVVATLLPVACPAIFPPPPGCYVVGDPHRAVAYIFDNDRNQSPRLAIVHPSDGDVFRAHSDIEIDVVTRDPDGWVTTMQFFERHNLIGEQSIHFIVPPPPGEIQKFSMIWSNVPPGDYVLRAKATDNLGAMTVSDPVNIKVRLLPPLPRVSIDAIDPVGAEPNSLSESPFNPAIFKVTREGGDHSQSLLVHYRIGGTASNGVDYAALSGEVEIPAGHGSAPVVIEPKDDALVEGTESVILSLVQPPCVTSNVVTADCYLVGQPGRAIVFIRDNDSPPNRPPTVAIVSPANGSVFAAPLDLRLVAAAGDSDGWVTTVEFFAGDKSLGIASNRVWILDTTFAQLPDLGGPLAEDTLERPFSLVWSNVPPGKHVLTAVATDNTGDSTRSRPIEIFVREHGDVPVVRIFATDPIAREGTTNTATFRIRRTGPTNSALTVFYRIRGTAGNGVDYVEIENSLTIPAGRRGGRILITPINDNLPERVETVLLRLIPPPVGPDTYEIGQPARAGALILDNDCVLGPRERFADGTLHLHLAVPRGMPYRLEATDGLGSNWEEVVSDIAAEDWVSVVEDPESESSQRYFRVVREFGEMELDD